MRKLLIASSLFLLVSCTAKVPSTHVWLTSAAGDKCTEQKAVVFHEGTADNAITIHVDERKQTIDGYGGSLTESSAFVLACLTPEQRQSILRELFSEEGANFSVVRTQIGSSDFSVEGKYALTEVDGDTEMKHFSLNRDKEGFPASKYPQVKNEQYDLYHLMLDVWNIKQSQADNTYRIMANTWTAPAWMKDNQKYYERENGVARGGALLPKYYQAYANYIAAYIEAWKQEGVNIWSVTPVNEPMGNDGGWESMDFSPQVETEFIRDYLAPTLISRGHSDVAIFGFDQNIFEMMPYADAIYQDSLANQYTTGMAARLVASQRHSKRHMPNTLIRLSSTLRAVSTTSVAHHGTVLLTQSASKSLGGSITMLSGGTRLPPTGHIPPAGPVTHTLSIRQSSAMRNISSMAPTIGSRAIAIGISCSTPLADLTT